MEFPQGQHAVFRPLQTMIVNKTTSKSRIPAIIRKFFDGKNNTISVQIVAYIMHIQSSITAKIAIQPVALLPLQLVLIIHVTISILDKTYDTNTNFSKNVGVRTTIIIKPTIINVIVKYQIMQANPKFANHIGMQSYAAERGRSMNLERRHVDKRVSEIIKEIFTNQLGLIHSPGEKTEDFNIRIRRRILNYQLLNFNEKEHMQNEEWKKLQQKETNTGSYIYAYLICDNRSTQVIRSRLRSRICGLANSTFERQLQISNPTNKCPCCTLNVEETVEHFIWLCPATQIYRDELKTGLREGEILNEDYPSIVLGAWNNISKLELSKLSSCTAKYLKQIIQLRQAVDPRFTV